MSGADIHTVALQLGHKDLRMAARYQHLSPAFLGEAAGKLDGVFGDLSPHSVPGQKLIEGEVSVVKLKGLSVSYGIRTRVAALKERCPRPG